jgi:hypothetical protein
VWRGSLSDIVVCGFDLDDHSRDCRLGVQRWTYYVLGLEVRGQLVGARRERQGGFWRGYYGRRHRILL